MPERVSSVFIFVCDCLSEKNNGFLWVFFSKSVVKFVLPLVIEDISHFLTDKWDISIYKGGGVLLIDLLPDSNHIQLHQ